MLSIKYIINNIQAKFELEKLLTIQAHAFKQWQAPPPPPLSPHRKQILGPPLLLSLTNQARARNV
ncbi:hypothetical protein Hanom_Chr16g01451841 [Helianthus anomalus]